MSFGMTNKIEMRRRALLEAIRFCGGVAALSRLLKVSRTRVSNWCNHPEIEVPYEYAILIEAITRVSLERLSPYTEAANKVIRILRSKTVLPPLSVELGSIAIGEHFYLKCETQERPIIMGTDSVLISGLRQIELQKSQGKKKVEVTVIDLEALLLNKHSLEQVNNDLLISERIAIGLRMEQLLGERRGTKKHLKEKTATNQENFNKNSLFRPTWDEIGRSDSYIAHLTGLSSKNTYRRAKQVFLFGNLELVQSMDCKEIPIAIAARKTKELNVFQRNNFHTKLQGVKL